MGSYFSDKWNDLQTLWAAILANPGFFVVAFAIGLPLIWWKWRVTGNSMQSTVDSLTHGLRADADAKTVAHETGIGTRDILVMRPPPTPKMIYFALFFFGGGALFFMFIHIPSDRSEPSDWWVLLALLVFSIGSMIVIEQGQTRIRVDDTGLQRRRVLHPRQTIRFAEIAEVTTSSAKTMAPYIKIISNSGDSMRIGANFSGYRQVIDRLAPYDANMALISKIESTRAHARTSRG